MLSAKIYINLDELEDIHIVNEKVQNKKGDTKYRVTTLEDQFTVYHNRANGWIKLLIKVLKKMQDRKLNLSMPFYIDEGTDKELKKAFVEILTPFIKEQ